MPISSSKLKQVCRSAGLRDCALLASLLLLGLIAPGQTLARPGWAGSGLTLEPWWTHAILYQIDPHGFQSEQGGATGDLRGITRELDYVHSLGVDAITLAHLFPQNFTKAQGEGSARFQTVDRALGTLDDFDELVREASRDGLRVVVELDGQSLSDPAALAGVARFWLGRGVAGISLGAGESQESGGAALQSMDPQQRLAQLHALHAVTKSFAGQRILVAEAASGVDASAMRHGEADLVLDRALATVTTFNAASIRTAVERLQPSSEGGALLAATDDSGIPRSADRYEDDTNGKAKVLATVLLATRANAQLYFGQEIGMTGSTGASSTVSSLMPWGVAADSSAKTPKAAQSRGPEVAAEEADPDSLLNWYRHLIDLHHGNAALRSGSDAFLNHDADNSLVWISRKQVVTPLAPAIVVACNLSAKPVTLSLTEDLRNLHLRGSFLRTVLRSDNGMGGMSLNAVKLPPYGVYIGELRF